MKGSRIEKMGLIWLGRPNIKENDLVCEENTIHEECFYLIVNDVMYCFNLWKKCQVQTHIASLTFNGIIRLFCNISFWIVANLFFSNVNNDSWKYSG